MRARFTSRQNARIGGCLVALCLLLPSLASANPPDIASIPLKKMDAIVDLEPLRLLDEDALREESGPWTRRHLRAWLWRERAPIKHCLEQSDRHTPLAASGGAVTVTLRLSDEGAQVTSEANQKALTTCLEGVLRALPRAALAGKVDYTLTLVDPDLDEKLHAIYSTRGKLQIAGASPGIIPSYEVLESGMLEAPRPVSLDTPLLRQREEATKHEETLAACYRVARERNPDIEGTVSVTITHDKKGRVTRIWWDRNTTGDGALLDCIEKKIKSWRVDFGTPEGFIALGFTFTAPSTTPALTSPTRPIHVGVISASPMLSTTAGATQFETIERHIEARRGRMAACHKRHSPNKAAGAYLLRVEADTRYRTITRAAIVRRERPNSDLEGCIEGAILDHAPTLAKQPERARLTLDWTIEFLAPHRGEGRLDADIEGRLLASEPPPTPIALLGPTRILEEDQLERAARVYEANGYAEQAISLWMSLANMTTDPVTRSRRVERALDTGEHFTQPDFYHQLLLSVARSRSSASTASIDTAQQAQAQLTERLSRAAKRAHRRALERASDRTDTLQSARELYEMALETATAPQEADLHFYFAECLIELSEDRRAAEHFISYRELAPEGDLFGEAIRGELFATKRFTQQSCEQMRHPHSKHVPTTCFERYVRRSDTVSANIQLDSRLRAEILGWSIELLREFGREDMASVREKRLLEDFDPLDIPVQFAP